MKKRIAVLYIATGRYIVFWKNFYKSCEKYFLKDYQKFAKFYCWGRMKCTPKTGQ